MQEFNEQITKSVEAVNKAQDEQILGLIREYTGSTEVDYNMLAVKQCGPIMTIQYDGRDIIKIEHTMNWESTPKKENDGRLSISAKIESKITKLF